MSSLDYKQRIAPIEQPAQNSQADSCCSTTFIAFPAVRHYRSFMTFDQVIYQHQANLRRRANVPAKRPPVRGVEKRHPSLTSNYYFDLTYSNFGIALIASFVAP